MQTDQASHTPRISIIIPAYNAEKYLALTLESVLAQTRDDWELIIVDDGSTDGTCAVAKTYAGRDPRIRLVHQANSGPSAARNRGFAESHPAAEYVIFVDADDVWETEALGTLSTALDDHPDALGAYGLARYIDGQGKDLRPGALEAWGRNRLAVEGNRLIVQPLDAPADFAMFAYWHRVATSGVMLLRRSALQAVGPFDNNLRIAEDYDLWLRLALRGNFVFVNRVVLGYRQHDSNVWNNPNNYRKMDEGALAVRRKLFSLQMTAEQRRIARLGYRFWEQRRSQDRLRWAWETLRKGQILQAAKHLRHAALNYYRAMRGIAPRPTVPPQQRDMP